MKKIFIGAILGMFALATFAQNSNRSTGTVQQTYKVQEPQRKSSSSLIRGIELTPIYGYALNGKAKGYRNDFKMKDAAVYGGALSVEIAPLTHGEFSFTTSPTTGELRGYDIDPGDKTHYDMAINYFQLGGVREVLDGPVKPFGLISVGATWFNMKDAEVSDYWAFSAALGGGVKFFFSDHIGIRLQGRLLLPMYFSGGGIFVGIGSGGVSSGLGVSAGVLAVQGDFSGGLVFRF